MRKSSELLKKFILSDSHFVPGAVALIMCAGLPDCRKSAQNLVQSMMQKEFGMDPEELMKVAEITEKDNDFCVYELGAVGELGKSWQWYPFTKRSRYLSCFVSALQNEKKDTKEMFGERPCKQDMFQNEVLNNCFYNLHRLLSALYNDKSASSIPVKQLTDDTTLTLINVWDIGFNRAILHFLTLLAGHLHHNFPIVFLGCPNDISCDHDHLAEPLDIDKCSGKSQVIGLKPILSHYSNAKFLLSFSHLARSYDRKRKQVCKMTTIVHPEEEMDKEKLRKIGKRLNNKMSEKAKDLCAEDLLCDQPWIVDQEITGHQEKYAQLKKEIESLVESERQSDIPLSWYFLRSAFFKTGQLFIKTAELRECARKCNIMNDDFSRFLKLFTGFGSIIHISDIPGLCDYVILNPSDFFHKLTELYYPRFNGDLKYGIASVSTLRRLFGGDFQFFCDVLTSCSFAIEIDSDRVIYDDRESKEQRRLPIAEKCYYIPSIRTELLAKPIESSCDLSLLLVYKKANLPTLTTEYSVKFLVRKDPNLHLLTCECYNVTRFQYYHQSSGGSEIVEPLALLSMISHGDRNEILVEENDSAEIDMKKKQEAIADITKEIIRAYYNTKEIYAEHHYKLLGVEPELELAIACPNDRSKYHYITTNEPCELCCTNEKFMSMWQIGKALWK